MQMDIRHRVPDLHIAYFVQRLQSALLGLVGVLKSPELREHLVWGSLLPFHTRPYGEVRSPGHIVRPDIVLTENGCRIVELDFIPSGRGFTLNCLTDAGERERFLAAYADWYASMRCMKIAYATTTDQQLSEDAAYFAAHLARRGTDIRAVDANSFTPREGELLDRLFYSTTLKRPLADMTTLTSECWIDSKLVFALVHDPAMTAYLEKRLGVAMLALLRDAMPPTFLHEHSSPRTLQLATERDEWVIKNSDVETDDSWGSRGVVVGKKYGKTQFERFLKGIDPPKHKRLGGHPVIQRYVQSVDFKGWWDDIVKGDIKSPDQEVTTLAFDSVTRQPATEHVYARLGVSFLICCVGVPRITYVPYGLATLRQDELAHGASNALFSAFRIV